MTAPPTAQHRLQRSDFIRPTEGRIAAGVAVGLGDGFGLDPWIVRGGFAVLALAGGLGLLLYGLAWALMPDGSPDTPRRVLRDPDVVSTAALGAVVLGGALLMRAIGLWPGDIVMMPLALAFGGLALLAMKSAPGSAADLPQWSVLQRLPPDAADAVAVLVGTRRGALARVIAGGVCVTAGIVALIVTVDSWSALRGTVAALIAIVVGITLVVGPPIVRLARALVDERQERVRADERAEVAAHLHDSVLQTLALVQRRADDPKEVVRLARMQERELRLWLLAGGTPEANGHGAGSLGAALEQMAADVEKEQGTPIEVVRVRDCPADGLEPLLPAAREAMVNAAHHSGAPTVSVYLEVESERVTIFVRDRGSGFDAALVPGDRGGITNSITGRMARAGGRAVVRSAPGEGTEVELELPRART